MGCGKSKPAEPAKAPVLSAESAAWAEATLGKELLTKAGQQPCEAALAGADIVLLYFSAHWCPPCRQFTPKFGEAFTGYQSAGGKQLAVVFVSSDKDEAAFSQYHGEQPWMAVPFGEAQRQTLGAKYDVQGIPSVIVLNGKNGQVVTKSGREDIMKNAFDLKACLKAWGVVEAPATGPAPAAAAVAPKAEEAAKAEPAAAPAEESAVEKAAEAPAAEAPAAMPEVTPVEASAEELRNVVAPQGSGLFACC